MAYDATMPKGPNATLESVRDNFVALKDLIDAGGGGGGGQVVVHFASTDAAIPTPIANGTLWLDSGGPQLKVRIGASWFNIG